MFDGRRTPPRPITTASAQTVPGGMPLQQVVVDHRRLLTNPWAVFFEAILSRKTYLEGTHAERIDPGPANLFAPSKHPPGTFYWETDRTVLYQSRIIDGEAVWVYFAGTMTDTLANQPVDLGAFDAGFRFDASDTGQKYLWDGTGWLDVTQYPYAMYGTHAERLAQPVGQTADGTFWVERDRLNAVYQLREGLWWYVTGTMWGTLVPDQRPTDLGARDGGFDFRTSAPPQRQFIWSGTAWQEVTPPSNAYTLALAVGTLILATAPQDIPGAGINISKSGQYWLQGVFDFWLSGGDAGEIFTGRLLINGATQSQMAVFSPQYVTGPHAGRATVTQQWAATLASGDVVKLQAAKTGGTGSSMASATHTTLGALWVSA